MLTPEQNERLTRVGPGTPGGDLLRRYWQPVCPVAELTDEKPKKRIRIMCEDLVAFRDGSGKIGVVEDRCAHRGVSLYYGFVEQDGLRCPYHGWKYDVSGKCMEIPSEPETSDFCTEISLTSYPCVERGGIVWTYMGDSAHKPELPDLEWARLPDSHRLASRQILQCNWLQGLEGGFDSSHLAFLHGGIAEGSITIRPSSYEIVPTDFGFVVGSQRALDDERNFWTANVMVMPFHKIIASVPVGAHMWVPMDDENTMLYCVDFLPHRPLTDEDVSRETSWNGIHSEMRRAPTGRSATGTMII